MAKKFKAPARARRIPTLTIRKGACKHTIDIHPGSTDNDPLHIDWNQLSREDRKVTYRALMDFARGMYGNHA